MAPYGGTSIAGDLSILPAANPTRHGKGTVRVASDFEFNGAADVPQKLKTTLSDFNVSSAKSLGLQTVAGNISLVSSADLSATGVNSSSVLSGKSTVSAALGIEHTANASSHLRTSTGTLDVSATAGALTVSGNSAASLSSAAGDVSLSAPAVGKKVDIAAPLVNVAAGLQGFVVSAQGVGVQLTSAGGNYSNTVSTGSAVTQAANDVRFTTTSGDFSATVSDNTKAFKAVAKNVELGVDASSLTTAKGDLTVVGNLTVSGTTTAIDTVNMTVKDNLIQLNTAPSVAGRFPGLLLARHPTDHLNVAGDQSALFIYDEALDRFRLGYTADSATSDTLTVSRAADLQLKKLHCSEILVDTFQATSISIPGFASVTFSISGNSSVAVVPEPTLAHYGAYDIIVVGPDGGSHGSWRICKSASSSASFVSIGAAQQGETQDELIEVGWPANSPPVFKHAVTKTNGDAAPIAYKLKYLTV
jgi:hypothetical protein